MRDYITIGSTPYDESCAQVGKPNYSKQMRIETTAFIAQLRRVHPEPDFPDAAFSPYYAVKSFPHDFGSYHEVCAIFDSDHEASVKWAYDAESLDIPNWDSESLQFLEAHNYDRSATA